MKKLTKVSVTVVAVSFALILIGPLTAFAATSPTLGAAESFSVLANTGITGVVNTPSGITENVENNAIAAQITALTTAMVSGTIYSSDAGNTGGIPPAATTIKNALVQTNASTAYDNLDAGLNASPANCIGGVLTDGTELTTLTQPLAPGVYCSAGIFNLTGNLTLAGTTGTWVFKTVTGITVANSASVTGGDPCNVWWRIGSAATIGNSTSLIGTIIASTGIWFGTSFTLNGRALAIGGDVTFAGGGTISGPTCTAAVALHGGVQSVPPVYPLINVTKIPSPLNLPAGPGPVTYTYKVTNIGAVAVSNIEVKDDKCFNVQFVSGDTNKDWLLDLTETWTYNCFKTVSQTETNTVTACGSAANVSSSGTMCDTANATVAVGVPLIPPLIHLVKVPSVFTLPTGGGAITYSYAVTNPGTVPLSDVSITDDKCTGLPGRVVGHPGDINGNNLLDPGEAWQFTCKTNLTQTTTNTGTAEGHANGFIAVDHSFVTVVVAPPSVVVPNLPNTGLPSQSRTPWDIFITAGILMVVSSLLVLALKKRTM